MKPLLVGEDNPYSADPRHALFPYPERSAGYRLATVILGLSRAEYLRRFDRVNLCAHGKWSGKIASKTADRLLQDDRDAIVLLGRKVAAAFGCGDHEPFSTRPMHCGTTLYLLPHPSGLSRAWNEPGAIERARVLLAPLLVLKCQHPQTYRMLDSECDACAERRHKQKYVCPYCDGDHRDCSSS